MSFYRDLTGRQFGRLTVLREANRGNNGGSTWICRCSCGNIEAFKGNRLLSGHNKRCGECGYGMFEFFDNDRRVRCVLPHGKGFIFDSEDLPLVCQFKWFIDALGYPKTSAGICGPSGKHLHTLLMNPEKGMLVDHVDGTNSTTAEITFVFVAMLKIFRIRRSQSETLLDIRESVTIKVEENGPPI
ncbi:MAG TPA: hypothetical protein DEV97_10510 [Lachnospiraceae bacterium]|nr:hypothetical protein [Lachnospiraceae bacterium]